MVNVSSLPHFTPATDNLLGASVVSPQSTSLAVDTRSDMATPRCEDDIDSMLLPIFPLAESFVEKISILKSYLTAVEGAVAHMHEYNIDGEGSTSIQYVRRVKQGVNVADYVHKCSEIKGIMRLVKDVIKHCPLLETKLSDLFFMESNFSPKKDAIISREYHLAAVADMALLFPDASVLLSLAEKLGRNFQMLETGFIKLKTDTEKMFSSIFHYAPSHPQTHYVQLAEGKSQTDWANYVKNLAKIDTYEKIPAKLGDFSSILDFDNRFIIKHKNPIYNCLHNMRTGRPLPDFTYLKEGWSDLD